MIPIQKIYQDIISAVHTKNIPIIGIDGLGGAGKSTISEKLCQKFENNKYHTLLLRIDDFIHMRKVRYDSSYPEWQCYYDLQWRWEYFRNVIEKIKANQERHIEIELYDKEKDTYFRQLFEMNDNTIVIVEGIFLQSKEIKSIFDYMVYMDIPEEVRLERVLKRDTYIGDTKEILSKYKNRYFPAEHKYIEEYQPRQMADLVIEGE